MFERLRIVTKLMIGFGLMLGIIAGLSLVGGFSNLTSRAALVELMRYKDAEALDSLTARRFEEARVSMWMALATGDTTYWANADLSMQIVANTLEELAGQTPDAALAAKIKHWSDLVEGYKKLKDDLQTLHGRNEAMATVQGKQLATLAKTRGAEIASASEQLRRGFGAAATDVQDRASHLANRLTFAAVGVGIVSLILGAALGVFITGSIRKPLARLGDAMARLAEGDLEAPIPGVDQRNELGDMARRVEVFKTNANEKRRVEAEAAAERRRAEGERAASSQHIAAAAEITAEAMRAVGRGWKASPRAISPCASARTRAHGTGRWSRTSTKPSSGFRRPCAPSSTPPASSTKASAKSAAPRPISPPRRPAGRRHQGRRVAAR